MFRKLQCHTHSGFFGDRQYMASLHSWLSIQSGHLPKSRWLPSWLSQTVMMGPLVFKHGRVRSAFPFALFPVVPAVLSTLPAVYLPLTLSLSVFFFFFDLASSENHTTTHCILNTHACHFCHPPSYVLGHCILDAPFSLLIS